MPSKLEFRREFPEYYAADPEPHLMRFGAVPYLTLEGQGKPGGPEFKAAIQAIKRMKAHAAEIGLNMAGRHHEIYLNDPRRVGESKAKTILRWPVAAA
jgi:hypothetical protein